MSKPSLRTVLLVDDNDSDNFFHRRVIKKSRVDVDVEERQYAQEALDLLAKEAEPGTVGLILLDINMPKMDGWEFLAEYEQLPEDRRDSIVVIMLSTSQYSADRERANKHPNVRGYLEKPLTPERFVQIVSEHFTIKMAD